MRAPFRIFCGSSEGIESAVCTRACAAPTSRYPSFNVCGGWYERVGVVRGFLVIDNEIFIALIKCETLCSGRAQRAGYLRLRAAAVLAYCSGLWFPEILALRRRHWLPEGRPCLVVEGRGRRPARTVPASPATIWAVRQFVGPSLAADAPIIPLAGAPLKNDFQRAFRRLARTDPQRNHGAGDLRASFEERIMRTHPNDPLAFYLVGAAPGGDVAPAPKDPPLNRLEEMLRRSGLPYKQDDLWRVPTKPAPA
jgi:hypothetical protein